MKMRQVQYIEYHWKTYGEHVSTWNIVDGVETPKKNINPETGLNAW